MQVSKVTPNIFINRSQGNYNRKEHGTHLLLANTMTLAPKIDERCSVVLDAQPGLAFFTETWLRNAISDNHVFIPGYHFTARNRKSDFHDGVAFYLKNSIKFITLHELYDLILRHFGHGFGHQDYRVGFPAYSRAVFITLRQLMTLIC